MCRVPSDPGNQQFFDTFSYKSRCFDFSTGGVACLVAECSDPNTIVVSYNGAKKQCKFGGKSTISFVGIRTVKCPTDFSRFCSTENCLNWCGGTGVCIKGECYLYDCSSVSNCNLCKRDKKNLFQCIGCSSPFSLVGNNCV